LLAYWFQGWYVNFSAGIFISETTKRLPQITLIGAGITIVANLVLIPYFGMMGSAAATLISYFTMAMVIYYYSTKAFKVPYQLIYGFGVILLSVALYYSKAQFLQMGFTDFISSILIMSVGALSVVVLSYLALFKRLKI